MHTSIQTYTCNIGYTQKSSHDYAWILDYTISDTQEANTHSIWGYLGQVSVDPEEGRRKKRERHTCGREIKVEQTAAQIEGSGLVKERNRKKKPDRKGMSE